MVTSCISVSMYKLFLYLCLSFVSLSLLGQIQVPGMPASVASTMLDQQKAWNHGDLEGFMIGYMQSDSLLFVGSNGVTTGYDATLIRYKKGYPDRESMGHLTFTNRSWTPLCENSALVIGAWRLNKDLGGMYSLVWRKINEQWVIVADHSSD
jgi:hypothetical protein